MECQSSIQNIRYCRALVLLTYIRIPKSRPTTRPCIKIEAPIRTVPRPLAPLCHSPIIYLESNEKKSLPILFQDLASLGMRLCRTRDGAEEHSRCHHPCGAQPSSNYVLRGQCNNFHSGGPPALSSPEFRFLHSQQVQERGRRFCWYYFTVPFSRTRWDFPRSRLSPSTGSPSSRTNAAQNPREDYYSSLLARLLRVCRLRFRL